MELIFKKYHKSELHTEKNYLIYDPAHNGTQLTEDLLKSISHRNFAQSYENLLIGPIMNGKKMTVRVLTSDGHEISANSNTWKIFETYLKDQGYTAAENTAAKAPAATKRNDISTLPHTSDANICEFGTVYYFPA